MSYIYLASPYTHPDPKVMDARFDAVLESFVSLIRRRIWAYSPIVHCHTAALTHTLPRDIDFWQDYNRAMIIPASKFTILTLDGWAESRGVAWEVELARLHNIPIDYMEPLS